MSQAHLPSNKGKIEGGEIMSKTVEAVYEKGMFRPLEPVALPEGEHVQIIVPEISEEVRKRLEALEEFEKGFEDLTEEQWELLEDAAKRRPFFGGRQIEF
jgi:predicted DNA-binding antitoxin AbrB/MazE fold protein